VKQDQRDLLEENARLREALARLEARHARSSADAVGLDTLFPVFPALLFLFSPDDRYLDFRAGEGLYVPPSEFLGRRIDEVLPPPVGPAIREAMRQARETGLLQVFEYDLPLPGGERHFEARILALPDRRVMILATDVTERRLAQATVRRQAAELGHLLALSPAVVYTLRHGPGGFSVAGVSENVRRILGYSPEEVARPGWWATAVHPEDRIRANQVAERVLAEGHLVHHYRFRHAEGRWLWIREELRRVTEAGGPTVEVAGSFSDVTAQREVEERLRESQQRFRRAFEDAPVGMAVVGLDERFLEVNEALCRILGYPAEALLALTVPEVTHPEDRTTEERHKGQLLKGDGSAFQMEKRYLRSDGQVVWGSLSVSLVRGPDGQPAYVIGQLEDITDRKLAEAARRASEERFRELIEGAPDLLAVFDAQGRVAYASPAALELLGYRSDQLLGRPATDMVAPEDAPRAMALLGELSGAPGATRRIELRMRRADGSEVIFDSLVRNLLHVPAVAGFVVNSRDVTHQRLLEGQVVQSQKLESIGRLAGGVAHDFNNLLIGILGYAEFLEEGIRAGKPALEDLAEIRKAGERARDLTSQLLAVARRRVSDQRVMDLNGVLRDSEKLLRRVLGEDIDLSVKLQPGPWSVKADPSSLQQVILNLVVNARDAMPRGGKLTVETANVELDRGDVRSHQGVPPGAYVLLAISDSGEGMPPHVLAHVFEPFFTTKAPGIGTGLGLATVYGIVKQAGGHIWLYSEVGRGTTFKIYLPRTEEAPVDAPPATPRPASQGTETVLVVEDEPGVRELAIRALRGGRYRVLSAAGGPEALELAARTSEPIHLLVTDVVMPGLSGKQVADALVAQRPGLRVLYVSGYTENTIVHHGVLDAGVHFLSKPFTPGSLLEKVRRVLDGS